MLNNMPKLSQEIWEQNYKAPGESSYEDTKKRIAKSIASVEQNQQYWTKQFEDLLNYFMPGGRIISNAGRNDVSATLLNCFVTPEIKDVPWDSMKGIMKLTSNVTLTLASEGGVGFNISFIRPEGELIKGTMVNTPGPLAFMELIDKASDVTTRGTTECLHDKETKKKIRKGAMMCVMSCFEKSTEILTNLGWVPIHEVVDMVSNNKVIYAIDENGNQNKITNPFVKEPEELYLIETEDGSIIEVTSDHEFEVKNIESGEVYLKKICDIDPDKELLKIIIC